MSDVVTVEIDGKPVEVIPKAAHDAAFARMRTSAEQSLLKDPAFLEKVVETHGQSLAEKLAAKHPAPAQAQLIEAAQKPLKDLVADLNRKLEARDERLATSELRTIAAEMSTAPDVVAQLLRTRVRTADDGTVAVFDVSGAPAFGANGPMSVRELVQQQLAQVPQLAKAQGSAGAGVGGVMPVTGTAGLAQQIADAEKAGDWSTVALKKAEQLKSLGAR